MVSFRLVGLACVVASAVAGDQELHLLQRAARISRPALPSYAEVVVPTLPPEGSATDVPSTAAQAAGVTENGAGDLDAFIAALAVNIPFAMVCFAIFMWLRTRYPLTYANNVKAGFAPTQSLGSTTEEVEENLNSRWGFWTASIGATRDQTVDAVGLDAAMLIEFTVLAKRILVIVGVPMICIMGPLNFAFGGHPAQQVGDYMSILSFGNIENGSWLYWVYAFVVWYVVIAITHCVYSAQAEFVDVRFQWLRRRANKQACTILVEGIPDEYRSDEKLKGFFDGVFQEANVASAYVTKNTNAMESLLAKKDAATDALEEAKATWKKNGEDPEKRPKTMMRRDAIEEYEGQLQTIEESLDVEREKLKEAAPQVGGVNLHTGFVTFTDPKFAQMASRQIYKRDRDEFIVCAPPVPTDIRWSDLKQDLHMMDGWNILGIAAVVGLYFAYTPLVIGVSRSAAAVDLGPLQGIWAGIAPTMGLTLMVCFLPTFLITIFRTFFILKFNAWAQQRLQVAYFYFQLVFVVLVPAIGANVEEFTLTVFTDPLALPTLLGNTMPGATHFFMNFIVMQWVTHSMNILRYMNLIKFRAFAHLYDEELAREKSEPEDQDYYGIGSRSARFAINLVIAIVYGTLCPPINLLTWINFFLCRIIYGYLMPFAENKKPDLGGEFWVEQLRHLFVALIIYVVVMCGVLTGRSEVTGFSPTCIAAPSLIYVIWSYRRFDAAFFWEELPIAEVPSEGEVLKERELEGEYSQPELTK